MNMNNEENNIGICNLNPESIRWFQFIDIGITAINQIRYISY